MNLLILYGKKVFMTAKWLLIYRNSVVVDTFNTKYAARKEIDNRRQLAHMLGEDVDRIYQIRKM